MPNAQKYEFNRPENLPPVACPLVLNIQGATVRGQRISHLSNRAGKMDYRLESGDIIKGRFPWSYP
jgi:hypothetical protein